MLYLNTKYLFNCLSLLVSWYSYCLFSFHVNFRIVIVLWKMLWVFRYGFHWICRWLWNNIYIYNNINSSYPWEWYTLPYLFMSSISFTNILHFSMCMSFTSLVNFIPRYFILIEAIVSGIVFLISLPGSSLLVYKNNRFSHIDFVSCNFTESITL